MAYIPGNMGLGDIAGSKTIFKRKFRWTLSFLVNCNGKSAGTIPESFCKTASRPKLSIDETQVDFLNGRMFVPGKGVWQEMSVSYYDVTNAEIAPLWSWLNSVYQIFEQGADPSTMQKHMASRLGDYTGTGTLKLLDGCGSPVETWKLFNAWPKEIDFGELDMASSDLCEIKATFRFSDAGYVNHCLPSTPTTCCFGCNTALNIGNGGGTTSSGGTVNGIAGAIGSTIGSIIAPIAIR